MAIRRQLRFSTLEDIVSDAEHLLAVGYDSAGKWSLAQCCGHLANWMTYPLEGFPRPPLPIAGMLWMVRKTVGRKKLLHYLETKSFPPGKPTMPKSVPAPGGDDRVPVERLKQAVAGLKAHNGPIHPSPLFGAMTKDELVGLQLVHTAHHLSFLVPKTPR